MNKSTNIPKSEVVTAIVTTEVPSFVEEVKTKNSLKKLKFKPFGSDNLYPQALAALFRKSVSLRGIINSKVIYTVAGGFQLDEKNIEGNEFITSVNNKGQSLTDIFENYCVDRNFSGNSFLEIVTDKKGSFLSIFHVQSVKCRYAEDGENIIIHPNWAKFKSNDKLSKELPLYPNFKKEGNVLRAIVHVADYEPDFDWYGIPGYISALDSAAIGYKTNKWNVSRLDNAFQTSGVLVIDGNMSDQDAEELKKEFKKEMAGEGNQGKILMIIKKLGGEGTEFTPINNNTEGDWMQLHNQSNDDLIIACNWKKSLTGITESSGFDTDRILNDYQIIKSTYIAKEQNKFTKLIQKITQEVANLNLDGLSIINHPPVSLITKLTADKFIKIWEARKDTGLDFDPEDENQQKFIDNDSTNNATKGN